MAVDLGQMAELLIAGKVDEVGKMTEQAISENTDPDEILQKGLIAGMDVVEVRKSYGERLAMAGGVDKHVVRTTEEAIRKELEYKMQPLMRGGGMLFGLDHRIPNGTPISLYRYYVRTAREILGLDPDPPSCWGRMAF